MDPQVRRVLQNAKGILTFIEWGETWHDAASRICVNCGSKYPVHSQTCALESVLDEIREVLA